MINMKAAFQTLKDNSYRVGGHQMFSTACEVVSRELNDSFGHSNRFTCVRFHQVRPNLGIKHLPAERML